jgi:molybdopterin-dependent oxidoreductase alpha subunit
MTRSGGGWHAIAYTMRKAQESGGFLRMYKAMRANVACKTCALGMGGQRGGMVNELGHFPEFCKKSIQAMASDLQPAIPHQQLTNANFDYLAGLSPRQLETMGRLTTPLVAEAGADHYRVASWEETIERLGSKLKSTNPDNSFFYFSGRSSNEAGFLLQLFARVYGTNHVNNCSFYCHQASGVGLTSVLGSSTGSISLEDLEHSDLLIVIGGNPASNHPRLLRTMMAMKRRGGKVVIINPLKEVGLVRFKVPSDVISLMLGSEIADDYLQPHIGGDIALLCALAKRLIANHAIDRPYLERHVVGWPAVEAQLSQLDDSQLLASCGVSAAEMDKLALSYAQAKAAVFSWAMGVTHHLHGTDTVRMIATLALMRGMVGKKGSGLLPLRGHSNIQGLGTVGVTPQLKAKVFSNLEKHFSIRLPTSAGMDTMACMDNAVAGNVRVAWCLGGNLFGSNPDAAYATKSLASIDQVVYLNTTLNTGHIHGRGKETWILPVLPRDEEPEATTQESMFSYIRLSESGQPRHQGPRSEVRIIAAIAQRTLGSDGPIDWHKLERHADIRQAIAKVVPGLEQLADIDQTKKEFHIPGRAPHDPNFTTGDHHAHVRPVSVPSAAPLAERQVRMMTIRSEGQFNTVVYEEHDRYRNQERRDVILLSRADIERFGLSVNQRVTVSSSVGVMHNLLVREFDIRSGNAAMYYPEANVLVPRELDPESRTPAFKHVLVTLT